MMDILTTRTLTYLDDVGDEKELVLTVYAPFEAEPDVWKCGFSFGAPINCKVIFATGVDALQAFVGCLQVAGGYLEGTRLRNRVHWQGMADCGLPRHRKKEKQVDIGGVFATRSLPYRDKEGHEGEVLLKVFTPVKTSDDNWECGFMFGPPLNTSIGHGYGADFSEALLSGLALAREILDIMDPGGEVYSVDREWLGSFPYQIDRSFWLGPADEAPPNTA